jgi:hypothetical protein
MRYSALPGSRYVAHVEAPQDLVTTETTQATGSKVCT